MKALTLWQPWASLIAIGAKRVETRSWHPPAAVHGTRIAIHAAKTIDHLRVVAEEEPFRRRILGAMQDGRLATVNGDLPLGAVVATAVVARTRLMTVESIEALRVKDPDEYAFGLYEPGRIAWVLHDVVPLEVPVPVRGGQKLWDLPADLLGLDEAATTPQGALL